jgi:LacI family transcriptional regulator
MRPPCGLIVRQSTDVLALGDLRLAAAVRLIRERARTGLHVSDLEAAIPLSPRELEARFRQHFGRSPHQEILRIRLLRAKALLTETKLTLADIAKRCGFEHPEYFNVVFKRHEQMTPRNWRLKNG